MHDEDALLAEVTEGLIKHLKIPLPSVDNPPSRKEVFFPAHIIAMCVTEMWKLSYIQESETMLFAVMDTIQKGCLVRCLLFTYNKPDLKANWMISFRALLVKQRSYRALSGCRMSMNCCLSSVNLSKRWIKRFSGTVAMDKLQWTGMISKSLWQRSNSSYNALKIISFTLGWKNWSEGSTKWSCQLLWKVNRCRALLLLTLEGSLTSFWRVLLSQVSRWMICWIFSTRYGEQWNATTLSHLSWTRS